MCLRSDRGGWLHVHGNTDDKHVTWSRWSEDVAASMKVLLDSLNPCNGGREWSVAVRHIEHVKSYGPHIDHIVADIECRPLI